MENNVNGRENETLILPAKVIQHIQSYMCGKEAARSTLLSKSWHAAWLSRPTIDLDDRDFGNPDINTQEFERFARKTIQRYRDLSVKIQRFRLRGRSYCSCYREDDIFDELVADAMELGPSDVELECPPLDSPYKSWCPPLEVLQSESIVRLSLIGFESVPFEIGFPSDEIGFESVPSEIGFPSDEIGFESVPSDLVSCCSSLTSLNLKHVNAYLLLYDMISRCDLLEELSLSHCRSLNLHTFGLHKLKRMLLDNVHAGYLFFNDFASRFPCLKDLTILNVSYGRMHITSSSLETISFMPERKSKKATFHVPNIRKFTYSGFGFPSLSINGASREWEFDITIDCSRLYSTTWFRNLKRWLEKFRLSRIVSLCIIDDGLWGLRFKPELGTQVEAKPLVVENLRIDAPESALLLRLFGICRAKFITFWPSDKRYGRRGKNEYIAILCKELMTELITPNCGVPNQNVYGQFGLKKVKMNVYDKFDTDWQWPITMEEPLNATEASVKKRKIRFELIWD